MKVEENGPVVEHIHINNNKKRSKKMQSYHGDKKIKEKYVARVKAHALADEIAKGQYADFEGRKFCAVGCTIHGSHHDRYETELGLPKWLARLEDKIFENLPNEQAKEFPLEFLKSIPVGADVEPVKWKFLAFLMRENMERVETLKINAALKDEVLSAIRAVLVLFERAIEAGEAPAARAAADAADAARSAANAADAARVARAANAANAANAAYNAARAAAYDAADAVADTAYDAYYIARAAAGSAAYDAWTRYRDELLTLLRAAD